MKRRYLVIAFVLAFLTSFMWSGEKERDWQTGKVLDTEASREFVGTVGDVTTKGEARASGNRATYQGKSSTSETAVYRVYNTVIIEGKTHGYVARQQKRFRWSKVANLTVNGPVKFAVEKRNLYLIDDDGKEHKLEIVKQVLKPKTDQATTP